MNSYMLDQIANWRACNARIPDGYEAQAVVEAIIDVWAAPDVVRQTALSGVHPHDREVIAEIIRDNALNCSVQECAEALLNECKARQED